MASSFSANTYASPVSSPFLAYDLLNDPAINAARPSFLTSPIARANVVSSIHGEIDTLNLYLSEAYKAHSSLDPEAARSCFKKASAILESRFEPSAGYEVRILDVIDDGRRLHREAVFGAAAYVTPNDAVETLKSLNGIIADLSKESSDASGVDLVRANLLKAFALMKHTSAFTIQRSERYESVERLIGEVLENPASQEDDNIVFSARALLLESLARQTERAHHRGDFKARKVLLGKMMAAADDLAKMGVELSSGHVDIAARYEERIISLLIGMKAWALALDRARRFTENEIYATTDSSRFVLSMQELSPFVEGGRILSREELKARAPYLKGLVARGRAALANAHSESLSQSIMVGGAAAAAAMTADFMFDGNIESVVVPAMVAGGASLFNKLRNGWNTEEALSAASIGLYERSMKESIGDAAGLILKGGLETGAWLAPTSLSQVLPEASSLTTTILDRALQMYGGFVSGAANGVVALFNPATYSNIAGNFNSSVSIGDAGSFLLRAYETGAAAQYLGYLLFPKQRRFLAKTAKFFIPGAVILGADLGMAISGKDDFWDRFVRGSISIVEGTSMLLAAGVIALAKTKSIRDSLSSIVGGIKRADHNALVAIALTVGVSSAMGGVMTEGLPKPDNIALIATKGAAVTLGLLPITILISGVLKRNVELFDNIKEGWDDSKGTGLFNRVAQSAIGGVNSFWTPYVFNRVGRSPTLDVPSAALRTYIGWDTNIGYSSFVGINFVFTNPAATMVFPETGGVEWERAAFVEMLKQERHSEVIDHWIKASQRMPLSHFFRPHDLSDKFFPLTAIRRIVRPPVFPLMPQAHYFGALEQLLEGGYLNSLGKSEMKTMFEAVLQFADSAFAPAANLDEEAKKAMHQDVLRPVIQTLYMARQNEANGEVISEFFADNSWLMDMLAIDGKSTPVPDGRYRRQRRSSVRKIVKMDGVRYNQHIREHSARKRAALLGPDAFSL
ncbi:MAG TPA: hypothetical protein PKU96_04585 [bacterium]|nr:hypothetical protein [bacterium]